MRVILLLCPLIALAAAQYDYAPVNDESAAQQLSQPIQQVEFNKEFYTYTAPSQEFDDASANQVINSMRKSLKVVFIRGPENSGLENAALQLAKSAGDDRTAIYVLSKQADIGDLANQLQASRNTVNNKPDVHFVKYRTQADADNAQRTIQSQYDSLPGTSSNHNAGSAPVLDFASKPAPAPAAVPAPAPAPAASPSGYNIPSSQYLPPSRRY